MTAHSTNGNWPADCRAKELAAADPDHDGTLTKDEYLAAVEQRFNAADPDHDGTLDAREIERQSRSGAAATPEIVPGK